MTKTLGSMFKTMRRRGRQGSIALMFALSLLPVVIVISVAVDMSRLVDGRAALQRAVDNAALSGATAYSANSAAFNNLAIVIATGAFCNATQSLPPGFTLVSANTTNGTTAKSCNNIATGQAGANAGPSISAVTGGYVQGTPGNSGRGCAANNTVITGVTCGFIVTVNASATLNTLVPALFGTRTITVTGVALNPFLVIGSTLKTTLTGTAANANGLWVYPLLLSNTTGLPDYSSTTGNPGALPEFDTAQTQDASPAQCNDNPLTTVCGSYTMIADTNYYTGCPASSPCYPNGPSGTEFVNGVVQNPTNTFSLYTATTPIGIAFESIAGGEYSYGYGQSVTASNTPVSPSAGGSTIASSGQVGSTGCYLPALAIYGTVAQVYSNVVGSTGNFTGTTSGPFADNPALPWPTVTHWFFSSYLTNTNNALPPDYGEILSQTGSSNLDVQSIGLALAGNVYTSTSTSYPRSNSCAPQYPAASPNDELLTTFFPSTGGTNRSVFFIKQAANSSLPAPSNTNAAGTGYGNPGYTTANGNNAYLTDEAMYYFTPAATPGLQYAALSCQSYGTSQFVSYWNDMGGDKNTGDTFDYGNGAVAIQCSGPSFVVLIQ